jgi:hypothetical protein
MRNETTMECKKSSRDLQNYYNLGFYLNLKIMQVLARTRNKIMDKVSHVYKYFKQTKFRIQEKLINTKGRM